MNGAVIINNYSPKSSWIVHGNQTFWKIQYTEIEDNIIVLAYTNLVTTLHVYYFTLCYQRKL